MGFRLGFAAPAVNAIDAIDAGRGMKKVAGHGFPQARQANHYCDYRNNIRNMRLRSYRNSATRRAYRVADPHLHRKSADKIFFIFSGLRG